MLTLHKNHVYICNWCYVLSNDHLGWGWDVKLSTNSLGYAPGRNRTKCIIINS